MKNTIVGVYDSHEHAQMATDALLAAGFSRDALQMTPYDEEQYPGQKIDGDQVSYSGVRALFGMEEDREHHDAYSEAIRRGSYVVAISAGDEDIDRVTDVMSRFDPIDIKERTSHWKQHGWSGFDEKAPSLSKQEIEQERAAYSQSRKPPTEASSIPVIEEQLEVGKREVQRGGVRVFQRVTEKPVHESVQLREEHVNVERRPVDLPASEVNLAAFDERTIELREAREEPVVSKTARVVEEVVVSKETQQHTEHIADSVRRTDVEIEQLQSPSNAASGNRALDDADFRRHWQSAYGQTGGQYEDYDSAYRYGSTVAGSDRYRNYQWSEVEPDLRSDWETVHPESAWEKVKDAVRYGAEHMKAKRPD
jgi:uncharacterized protein (TIGR02271 family)